MLILKIPNSDKKFVSILEKVFRNLSCCYVEEICSCNFKQRMKRMSFCISCITEVPFKINPIKKINFVGMKFVKHVSVPMICEEIKCLIAIILIGKCIAL